MKIKLLLIAALAFVQGLSFAQRNCGTMDHHDHLMQQDPSYAQRRAEIEGQTARIINEQRKVNGTQAVTYTIPVVVHVVYRTAAENISDAQVLSQIAVLNEDFQLLNADHVNVPTLFAGVKANVEINFCLAQRDPNGAATNGITRTVTTRTSFGTNDAVKSASTQGKAAWNTSNYLNIWVCNIGGGILGYAQFPGGPASTDGVVIDYRYFGRNGTAVAPFNKGRTATHEVGHWLNLYHIWGDATCGNDQVSDTPLHNTANYGCPAAGHRSTCTGTPVEMTMNYMDYTDDACMYMFSTGQSNRMRALFGTGGARVSLLSSQGCNPPTSCNAPTGLTSSSITTSSATVSWGAVSGASSYNLQYKTSAASTFTTVNTTSTSYSLTGLSSATSYVFQVQTVCSGGNSVYSSQASFTTSSPPATCNTPTGLAASSITSSGASMSWAAVSGALSYNLQYKTSAASTFTTVNTTGTSYALSGLSASTAYVTQVQAVCSGASSTYSSQVGFTTSAASLTYCTSKGNSVVDEWIDYVALSNLARTSGADAGYIYFTSTSSNVSAGTSYTLTISAGFRSGYSATEHWRIWADWNQNGVFTDAGELMVSGSSASAGNLTATFAVPATAKNGTTRMRVSMKWNSAQTSSCETFSYGEVEDYILVVSGGVNREVENTIAQSIPSELNDLVIYPNPVHDRLFFDATQLATFEESRVTMVDMQGRVVVSEWLKNPNQNLMKSEIETGNLANGLYNLIISTEKGRITKKIQILHP